MMIKVGQRFWVGSIALIFCVVQPASAGDYLFSKLCIRQTPILPRIPIGCEVVDCCPGCPGPGPLEWHIHLTSDVVKTVVLKFQNLSPERFKKLRIQGNVRRMGANQLRLGKGESIIGGFTTDPAALPPVAVPLLAMDTSVVRNILEAADKEPVMTRKGVGSFNLVAEQMIGPVVVAESRFNYVFEWCAPPSSRPHPPTTDLIDLGNNAGNDDAVVLLDGRRSSGCVNDEIWRGNGIINVGSVLSNGTCNSEVAVFSDDDAMQLLTPVTIWTNALGDRFPVDLTPNLLQVPVTIWVMQGPFATTQARAVNDLARASFLYNTMNSGITFQTTAVNDATGNPNTAGLLNATCGSTANLRAQIGFTAGQLNVYYLNNPGGARGWWCGNNTIIVGAGADNESLSHEIGHSFSLGHVNNVDYDGDGIPDFPNTNVMWGGGVGRNSFTEGQCFRMNVNNNSTLNTNGLRVGPTRNCPDATVSPTCPWSGLDALPN